MTNWKEPAELNDYLEGHVRRLLDSFRHCTGKDLVQQEQSPREQARALFYAPLCGFIS
jgi:hypothetical protein